MWTPIHIQQFEKPVKISRAYAELCFARKLCAPIVSWDMETNTVFRNDVTIFPTTHNLHAVNDIVHINGHVKQSVWYN